MSSMKKGFTLIEAILYLAIAGTVLYFISGFAFNSIFGKAKIETIQDVNQSSQSVLDQMSNTVSDSMGVNGFFAGTGDESACDSVCQSLRVGLVGYWPLDGNFRDYGNYGLDESVVGSTPGTIEGKVSGANYFDGSGNLNTGHSSSHLDMSGTDFTVSAWVYPTRSAANGYGDGIIEHNYSWGVWFNGTRVRFWSGDGTDKDSSGSVSLNSWSYITIVFHDNNNSLDFYINGHKDSHVSFGQEILVQPADYSGLEIGSMRVNNNRFQGNIDEVSIWRRALSPDEISLLYNDNKGRSLMQ